jgi:hypothetical protein
VEARAGDERTMPRAFFVNSAFAFACAQLLTAAFHEAGHGVAAQLLGFSPHIYAFYEDNAAGNPQQTLTILAAGPVASLVLGALFWIWYARSGARYSFGRLLLLWLALSGVTTFVNYLIVTPWLSAGDTAQIADVLHWPTAARYGLAVFGVALTIALAPSAARAMFGVAPGTVALDSPYVRRRFIFRGFYLPLVAGTLLTAFAGIASRPVNVGYGLLAMIGTIDMVVAAMYARTRPSGPAERRSDARLRVEPAAIVLWIALTLLYVLGFSHGVPV